MEVCRSFSRFLLRQRRKRLPQTPAHLACLCYFCCSEWHTYQPHSSFKCKARLADNSVAKLFWSAKLNMFRSIVVVQGCSVPSNGSAEDKLQPSMPWYGSNLQKVRWSHKSRDEERFLSMQLWDWSRNFSKTLILRRCGWMVLYMLHVANYLGILGVLPWSSRSVTWCRAFEPPKSLLITGLLCMEHSVYSHSTLLTIQRSLTGDYLSGWLKLPLPTSDEHEDPRTGPSASKHLLKKKKYIYIYIHIYIRTKQTQGVAMSPLKMLGKSVKLYTSVRSGFLWFSWCLRSWGRGWVEAQPKAANFPATFWKW